MTTWSTLEIASGEAAAAAAFSSTGFDRVLGTASHRPRAGAAIRSANFAARMGRWLDVAGESSSTPRLLVLGLGADDGADTWLSAGGRLPSVRLPAAEEIGGYAAFQSLLTGALLHSFHLTQNRREPSIDFAPTKLVVDAVDWEAAAATNRRVGPINRARAWVEQPANILTPPIFAEEATSALDKQGVKVRVLGPTELEAIGAEAILAVSRASEHEPRLLIAEWRGDSDREGWDTALVGKGLTFDSGGLNLKVRPVIEKMKFDMGGAAAVLGAVELAASRRARVNVVAVVPMAENAIGGKGLRPGDVLRSLSGLTIEVVNTDAEGRLVLADGITYAISNYQPRTVIDIATLTGSMAGVLHEEFGGLYASDDNLAESLLRAGTDVGEELWRMPLSPAQDYLVSSPVADLSNLGAPGFLGLGGGSPAAGAKFLEPFARGTKWAHIDMAGPAWSTRRTLRSPAGATGFGVALIDCWLASLEQQ